VNPKQTCRVLVIAAILVSGIVVSRADAVVIRGGDILVVDFVTDNVVHIDPVTGAQTSISSGGVFLSLFGVGLDTNGLLYVVDRDAFNITNQGSGGVIRVDPATGQQTVVSVRDNLESPMGMAVEANGDVVAASFFGDSIVRVDPATGAQSLVATNGLLSGPIGLVVETNGNLLVADSDAPAVLRVDPASGAQVSVSQAGLFNQPSGVAVEADGHIVVADIGAGSLFRIDPATGAQSVVTAALTLPFGVAVEADGSLLVTDHDTGFGPGRVVRVDPVTGVATVLSSGNLLAFPTGIFVVPAGFNLLGDFDGDGDVDLADYAFFAGCQTLPGGGVLAGCDATDIDSDGDTDLADFAGFTVAFTGAL